MNKAYFYDTLTACALLAIVEAYFWSQSRSLSLADTTAKLILTGAYLLLAILSQVAISRVMRFGARSALKTNALVAMILGIGITLIGFTLHTGIFKDVSIDFTNIVASAVKIMMTVGLATLLLRVFVAGITWRLAQR